jgi:DNA-binding response OmpR family regulator
MLRSRREALDLRRRPLMKTLSEPVLGHASQGNRASAGEATILVIDDDPSMHDILAVLGTQHGFGIQFALDGNDGLRLAEQNDVDLIVLDLNLPGLTGFDVCRRIRALGIEIPIVMVSASSDPVDVVVGLEIGADDYVIKPFEIRELAARINAKLRRQRTSQSQVRPGRLKFPGLIVDVGRHEVLRDGVTVTLTPTEFDLLALLSASPGRVISRTEMIQKVWGQGADLDLRSVDAHVYRLRRKIEPEGPRPTYIHAVPGIGYRFERRGLTDRLSRAGEDNVDGSDEDGLPPSR